MLAGVGLAVVVGVGCAPLPPSPPPPVIPVPSTPPGAVPAGLPGHLGVGLSAGPGDLAPTGWVGTAGIPFDYAYQYLAGGVNTGQGWETWNAAAQFPLFYAQDARARGAIPVLSYYMLLQSSGPCGGCGEAQRDLANLNSGTLMAAYYADFAKLMERLGAASVDGIAGYGRTAVVQVEPDLSGYAQQAVRLGACYGYCSGTGESPDLLHAAVASSGVGDVAAYPNTWRGFNLALLHLRDRYAPNVKLAFHVSDWTTGRDIGSDTDPTLDPAAEGAVAASFAAASGVSSAPAGTSTYDLVFNDVSDRDAGYYKYVLNRPNAFWDRLNATLPNFARWERFVAAVTAGTGRRAIVWQIPVGNQVSRSENNTPGHYQDNRAEYFFGHLTELRSSGIIGLLFGRGNAGSTTYTDDQQDGITNPPQVCNSDGLSSGVVCNAQVATVSDDDGGYLRAASAAYLAAPLALP